MNLLQQMQLWTKGDVLQGRWMIGIALVIFLPSILLFFKNNNPILHGMWIPLFLLLLMNIGYGSYLVLSKPKSLKETKIQYKKNPIQTVEIVLGNMKQADKSYRITKLLWATFMAISVLLYFVFTKNYFKGLTLGLMIMFFGMLVIDTMLHQRVKQAMETINHINT